MKASFCPTFIVAAENVRDQVLGRIMESLRGPSICAQLPWTLSLPNECSLFPFCRFQVNFYSGLTDRGACFPHQNSISF